MLQGHNRKNVAFSEILSNEKMIAKEIPYHEKISKNGFGLGNWKGYTRRIKMLDLNNFEKKHHGTHNAEYIIEEQG